MHGSKIATSRNKSRPWLAVVIGLDSRTCERRAFRNRKLALWWIEREGAAKFRGKAERVELYNDRKMMLWSKSFKTS
jgi:hypothetical protein